MTTEGTHAETTADLWEPVRRFEVMIRQADEDARRIAASADPSQSELNCALTRSAEAAFARTLAYREARSVYDEDEAARIAASPNANRMDVSCAIWRRDLTREALRLVRLEARNVAYTSRSCECTTCSELRTRRIAVAVEAEMDTDWEIDRAEAR